MTRFATRMAALGAALLLTLAAPLAAQAHSYRFGDIDIGHVWAPPPAGGVDGVAVYGPLFNEGQHPVRLVGASSPIARAVRFRVVKDGQERWLKEIDLPVGVPVSLAGWREHIWLSGLKKPLKAGDRFDLTLDFGDAGSKTVEVMVQASPSD